jgi:proteasome lid subunit RPN8/RPN11
MEGRMSIKPIPKPIPNRDQATLRQPVGLIHQDAVPVVIHENVLEEILDYSERDLGKELGGFLLGGLHEDGRPYVEIRKFFPATDAESRAASLTFTHDTWAQFHRQADEKFPGELIVGWQHTHPDFGVFLSGYDLFIHRNFFSQPWQIALVVDPVRREFEFYQWRADRIASCGFICIQQPNSKSGRKA